MAVNRTASIRHNAKASRFEFQKDGHLAVLEYHLSDRSMIFTHTGVPDALAGQGIGSLLVSAGLEYACQNNLKVRPLCSFVAGYIQKHPEYQDLL